MADFKPGDLVLFNRGLTDYVARIRYVWPDSADYGIEIDSPGPGTTVWYATPDRLTPLPPDTPAFQLGDNVQVRWDAPQYAARRGEACGPEFHGEIFGYWVWLAEPNERVWIPAGALAAFKNGGAS